MPDSQDVSDRTTRVESDSLGEIAVPADRYWGAQTQRSLTHFAIGAPMPVSIIRALALIKKAAARCNERMSDLRPDLAAAICGAADEVIAGQLDDNFPLAVYQTGSGTHTNMNVNEVIANRANEVLGAERGAASPVHPNDHVNKSQSSNDTFPTAMSIAVVDAVDNRLLPSLTILARTFEDRRRVFGHVVKVGRTHLMDAVPITVGHELDSFVAQIEHAHRCIVTAIDGVRELPIGGTAVGTGLNTPPGWDTAMIAEINELTGGDFRPAPSKLAAQAAHDAFVFLHGALRTAACALMKIANDVRWLASGPRAGLGELRIPANEPGSSIMPGKVNPTQCEAMLMVCARVLGNDVTIGCAGASGDFQLNVFKPLIASVSLSSIELLAAACASFEKHLVRGLMVDEERMAHDVGRSLMLVTALAPHVGYDRAAAAAKQAHEQGRALREVAIELGIVSEEEYDRLVDPSAMATPR